MMPMIDPAATRPPPRLAPGRAEQLRTVAEEFEAAFLAEMLKSAGFGKAREQFGGGVGEDAFASFIVREQATRMVAAGGIGLAEHIHAALLAHETGDGDV